MPNKPFGAISATPSDRIRTPPNQPSVERQIKSDSFTNSGFLNIVAPVVVRPETASK